MTFGINWNYIQAKRQADRLEEQAERLKRLAKGRTDDAIRILAAGWKGESAGTCIRKAQQLQREMESAAAELMRTAEVIQSSADRTYRAEMKVREMARTRKY